MAFYDGWGNKLNFEINIESTPDFDSIVKGINHRGYNSIAPENTLPAFRLSAEKGFKYVEADVSFTSDGVAVLLHDTTINRTARNADGTEIAESININSITYEEAVAYDYGVWKSSAYAGTKIPTFAEFLSLCRALALHPYIELKSNGNYTNEQVTALVDTVEAYGMTGKVTWISPAVSLLTIVKDYDPYARLGLVCSGWTDTYITNALSLKTETNEVFIDNFTASPAHDYTEVAKVCIENGLPLEVWTINFASIIVGLDPYVTGVTSDSVLAGKALYEAAISQ